jgi:hypothetical protein
MRYLLSGVASVLFTTLALTSAHAGGHRDAATVHGASPIGSWQADIRRFF